MLSLVRASYDFVRPRPPIVPPTLVRSFPLSPRFFPHSSDFICPRPIFPAIIPILPALVPDCLPSSELSIFPPSSKCPPCSDIYSPRPIVLSLFVFFSGPTFCLGVRLFIVRLLPSAFGFPSYGSLPLAFGFPPSDLTLGVRFTHTSDFSLCVRFSLA